MSVNVTQPKLTQAKFMCRELNQVAPFQHVADQAPGVGVGRALGAPLEFAQLADVVQHGPGDDDVLIQRRIEVVIKLTIFVGQVATCAHHV